MTEPIFNERASHSILGVDIYAVARMILGKLRIYPTNPEYDDLMQEAVVEMWTNQEIYNSDKSKPITYFSLLAMRGVIKKFRENERLDGRNPRSSQPGQKNRGVHFSLDDTVLGESGDSLGDRIPDLALSPEQRLVEKEDKEEWDRVLREKLAAIEELSPRREQIMKMLLEGKSIGQIALEIGVMRQTVDSHLFIARRALEPTEIKKRRENKNRVSVMPKRPKTRVFPESGRQIKEQALSKGARRRYWDKDDLTTALASNLLTNKQREVIVLLLEGNPSEEIAAILQITPVAVYLRGAAALRRVKEAARNEGVKMASQATLREVLENGQSTPAQEKIIELILSGMPMREIAEELGISPTTVSIHKRNALKRYEAGKIHS